MLQATHPGAETQHAGGDRDAAEGLGTWGGWEVWMSSAADLCWEPVDAEGTLPNNSRTHILLPLTGGRQGRAQLHRQGRNKRWATGHGEKPGT